jgi:adenylate cyclase
VRFEFGEHSLDVDRHELRWRDEKVAIGPQVFDLLAYLLRNRDRVVSRDDLIAGVWGGRIVSDSAVTTRINAARRAVGDSGAAQTVIRTVARKGVRFIAEVHEYGTDASRDAGAEVERERTLATILFTDIVDSTRWAAELGDRQWRALLDRHDEISRHQIGRFGGKAVKTTGDGFLATFDSPARAVRCALAIAQKVSPLGIAVRSGLHAGEIEPMPGDITGIAVHTTARIAAMGGPGEVVVSRTVRDLVAGSGLVFEDRGIHRLRGLPKELRLYTTRALGEATAPPLPRPASVEPLPSFAKPSILVLPFRNMSGDPGQEYLTDAVTSDLTVDLSRMRDIVVISPATALSYKGSTLDIRQIGRELGIRYLVVGSIGRSGDRLRTNVQLIEAASGEQRWGDRFENAFVDLEGLEDAITGRIAASLNVQLVRAEGRRAEKAPQPDALDLRLRATSLFYGSVAPEHTWATRQLLQRSAALDPSSAETWARLGQVIASDHRVSWNNTGKEELREGEDAVQRALLIDPNHALAHVAHGLIEGAHGRHHSALEAFSRAIELDRNFAFAYAHKGNELIFVGRPAEAPALVDQAIRLSPHDPSIGIFHWIIGRANFFAGHYDQAIPWFRKSIETRPNLWFNRLYLVSAYALADALDEAVRGLEEFNRRFPAPACTVTVVKQQESANPNNNPTVVAARNKFHDGLLRAGMPER